MPSSYTPSLRLTLPVTGELAGTWGSTVNTGVTTLAEAAIAGTAAVAMTDADYTLTVSNGATDQARNMFITLTGTLSVSRNVICPAVSKLYVVTNNTTGSQNIVFKTSAGAGITIANGQRKMVYCNGTDVVDATTSFTSIIFDAGTVSAPSITFAGSTNTGFWRPAVSTVALSTAGVERLRVDSSGNLGIGTASPGYKLDVTGIARVNSVIAADGANGTVQFGSASTYGITGGVDNGGFRFNLPTGMDYQFRINSSDAMRLTSAGNLGVGVSAPSTRLDVNGNAQLRASGYLLFLNNDNTNSYYVQNNGATGAANPVLDFVQGGVGTRMRLDSSGNLGIGTSSPAAKLNVVASSNATDDNIITLGFALNSTSQALASIGTTNLDGANGGIKFSTASAGVLTERANIDSAGNLGIGTATPATYGKLVVWGGNAFVQSTTAGVGSKLILSDTNNQVSVESSPVGAATDMVFKTSAGTKMTLDALGNLGVGTSSPTAFGAGYTTLSINSTTAGVLDLLANGVSQFRLFGNGTENRLQGVTSTPITFFTDSIERMRLDASGNLGVGTSSPEQRLHLSNTGSTSVAIKFTNSAASAGIISYSSDSMLFYTANAIRATIDTSGNLGLGVTPSAWNSVFKSLDIGIPTNPTAAIGATSGGAYLSFNGYYNSSAQWIYKAAAAAGYYAIEGAIHKWWIAPTVGTAGTAITFTQAMTLDASGNLGIGTSSPIVKLAIQDTERLEFGGASGVMYSQTLNAARTATVESRAYASFLSWWTGASGSQTEKMRLDSSGNLGLGVTPSAWGSLFKSLDIGAASSVTSGAVGQPIVGYNFYNDNTNNRYKTSNFASKFEQANGTHAWHTAPSGTAGNAITFTQAMTLDASGNLGVGVTPSYKLDVYGTGSQTVAVRAATSGDARFYAECAGTNSGWMQYTRALQALQWSANGSTQHLTLDSSGNLLVGKAANDTTTSGTTVAKFSANVGCVRNVKTATGTFESLQNYHSGSYVGGITYSDTATALVTSSDYRLKDITGPITTSGAYIDSLNPVEGTWKADGSTFVGLIAHEVQEVSRTTVATGEKDGEQMQAMDYSNAELVANLIAEIQSLRARVAALEAV